MIRKPPSPLPKNFRRGVSWDPLSWGLSLLGLGLVALVAIHAVSVLLFSVLGLAISSPNWPFVPTLGGVLAIATGAVAVQSFGYSRQQQRRRWFMYRISGVLSGAASGAVLGFFYVGSWQGNHIVWAFGGLAVGSLLLGFLAALVYGKQESQGDLARATRRHAVVRWMGVAIALTSSICAYGLAYGLGAWAWSALNTGRLGLAIVLAGLSLLSLWCVRRSWFVISNRV